MAFITLSSGKKVWSEIAVIEQSQTNLEFLVIRGPSPQSAEAIQILSEIGTEAATSVPIIEAHSNTLVDTNTYKAHLLELVDKIKHQPKILKIEKERIDVELKSGNLETDAQVFKRCNFCEKETLVTSETFVEKLCQPGNFYCRFCLRHEYNNRDSRNILMLTMRSVFGYYFWQFYYCPTRPTIWISEIKDYINLHAEIGLKNPLFNYDPETYLWFINFRRIGDSKKKLPLKEVNRTIVEMLASFNLHFRVKGLLMCEFYSKYATAISEFYHKRHRPEGKKLLAPTFKGCGSPEWGTLNAVNQTITPVHAGNKIAIEDTKNFLPCFLEEHLWNKLTSS
jgi:hypothetical protein